MAYANDRRLRTEIRNVVAKAMKGGLSVALTPSDLSFPAPDSRPSDLGTAVAALAARTAPRHLAAFHLAMERTRAVLAAAKRPALQELRRVFVDRHGQIWREDGAIVKTTGKPIADVTAGDVPNFDAAFFGIKETRGIYHWLVDRVSGYAWMRPDGEDAVRILLGDKASPFEAQTLELLGLDARIGIVGDAAFVDRLILPRVGFEGLMYWNQVSPVFGRLKELAVERAATHGVAPRERLYISRSDAKRRPLANEKEIEAALSEDGYDIVSFTGMPLWQQFFVASSATDIVAPHGAGLSHLILCAPGTRVTEILPISDGTHKLRFNYARLSLARSLSYQAWLEPQIGEDDSWSVDTEAFLAFLRTERS